jgi:hypothetical protein
VGSNLGGDFASVGKFVAITEPAAVGAGAAVHFAAAFLEIASSCRAARSWPFGHLRPTA